MIIFTRREVRLTLITVVLLSCYVGASEVTLFEMAAAPTDLKWLQFSMTHDTDAWMEETWRYPTENDNPSKFHNQRAYVSCNLEMTNPSNWLFTDPVATKEAKRVHIELNFSTRDCQEHPDPKSCKETFGLFMKQYPDVHGDDRISKTNFEQKKREWKKVGTLSRESNITIKTMSVPIQDNTKSIRFAFEEQGLCLSLLNIRIFYRVCDEFSEKLVHFNRQVVSKDDSDVVKMIGACIPNASVRNPGVELLGLCLATGKGIITAGECSCDEGYAPIEDSRGTRCESCPANTYRTVDGAECLQCPENSRSDEASGYCTCLPKYFRSNKESLNAACTQPPSRPVHLKFSELSSTSVRLSWEEPANLGGRRELWYEVRCYGRSDCSTMRLTPDTDKLYSRTVVVSGLKPKTDYTFTVYSMNKVSTLAAESQHSVIDVQTKSEEDDVAPVGQLRVDADQKDGVTIAWSPADISNTQFEVYVSPALTSRGPQEIRLVNATYTTFIGLMPGVVYTFKVRVKDDHRWSEQMLYEQGKGLIRVPDRKSSQTIESDAPVAQNMGNAYFVAIMTILIVIAIALCMLFVQKRSKNRKQMSDLDVLDTYKQDSMTPDYHTASRQPHHGGNAAVHEQLRAGKINAPLIPYGSPVSQPPPYYGGPTSGKYRAYVDPTAYEDPNQALSEFAFDIDPNDVFITQVIGGGEFGDVCLGGLSRMSKAATKYPTGNTINRMFDNEQFETVAIKTLKEGSSQKAKSEFLVEASIMGQFSHPNVIRLIGVVTSQEPIMIVTEYMANGSLDQYMRIKDQRGEKLQWEKVTEMMYGVASGMKYLTDMGYVHRDLAARNVLVDMELRCKIADFGLSRGIEGSIEPEYTTNGGKIPVRWTAPEAITHRKFTAASDVWSYGVVLWEVCSYGERPYWDWTNQKVISEIMIGYRLPPPMDCPIGLYRIAQWCWRYDRHERPTFAQLVATMHKYMLQPSLLHADPGEMPRTAVSTVNLNTYGSISNIPTPPNGAPPMPTLEDFLLSIGLHHCYPQLLSGNIPTVAELARRNHIDLLACGLISQECTMIREALQGRLPPSPPCTATLPHPAARSVRVQHHPLGNTIRRDEGFFV